MFLRAFLLRLGFSGLLVSATPVLNRSSPDPAKTLPTIDLGYAVYQASSYDSSYDAYVFSNIRFAAAPTGELRFGPPQPPVEDRSTIHNGSVGFNCPQTEAGFLPNATIEGISSEDCLFLDVIVPRSVIAGDYGDVPVLFWIYGGGNTLGSKTGMGDPINFLKHSVSPVVYVAPNYRLGIFGWLGGPSFTLSAGTVPNAGLHDQRFALQWVQKHIHLFHGKKDEVTVMGVSAGAASIIHHITANGGKGELLFQRAVPLSPGYFPTGGHASAEVDFNMVEANAGCMGKGIECIRALSTERIQKVNRDLIIPLQSPNAGLNPVIDGIYVLDAPSYLLAQGRFHNNITVLVADDIDEAFLTINISSTATIPETMAQIFLGITNNTLSQLMAFYPPPSDITPYNSEILRKEKAIADIMFDCGRYSLAAALPNKSYNLVFDIEPFIHGTGTTQLFNDAPGWEAVMSQEMKDGLRRSIMNFVVTGNPNDPDGKGIRWPVFGSQGNGLKMGGWNTTNFDAARDKEVCKWWAKALMLT